eukprot:GHVL01022896.1.p1 GENE.GHVL01022896.1~~GHVL01022896.1.p1  ORF type:complete len:748 (-),score=90.75 GHVL01022896.1:349-2592(-)
MTESSATLACKQLTNKDFAFTNKIYLNPSSYNKLKNASGSATPFAVLVKGFLWHAECDPGLIDGSFAVNLLQRKCAALPTDELVNIQVFPAGLNSCPKIGFVTLQVDTAQKNLTSPCAFKEEDLTKLLKTTLMGHVMRASQLLLVSLKDIPLELKVVKVERIAVSEQSNGSTLERGVIVKDTEVCFESQSDRVRITGKKKSDISLFRPDFNFAELGIGGLDKEFSEIFRRAFASRIFPPNIIEELGITHVRGMLLHGPPGTGKTLIARQIGKTLKAREPKIVNGPEILNKYVGQSEENIRALFKDAEDEYKKKGDDSGLHIIIFDEIDAVCKSRGSSRDSTGVGDSVVNQLLAKIDGVDALNNILLIAMTNRMDMIDEALLRPGRLEVHVEISLPDESGRVQIISIHTAHMRKHNRIANDVDINKLSKMTKNFSGAEIAGLVRSATSFAFNRQTNSKDLTKPVSAQDVKVTWNDFLGALSEVQPAFGADEDQFSNIYAMGIIDYGPMWGQLLHTCRECADQVKQMVKTPLLSLLLKGPIGSGKSSLAAHVASLSKFPFMKVISPNDFVGYGEAAKVSRMAKVFDDAYKSPTSLILLDSIERLLEYTPIGPRFSNVVLQALLVLVKRLPKKARRIFIIGTTSEPEFLEDAGLSSAFQVNLDVPLLSSPSEIKTVLASRKDFAPAEVEKTFKHQTTNPNERWWPIGIKNLILVSEMAAQQCKGNIQSDRFIQCLKDCNFMKPVRYAGME